ncbi:MAG TPA: L-threonylcarbamoyladenylate synthase [Gemmatimonadaceae bacterium]
MRVVRVDPGNIDPAAIAEAATTIRAGGLVAFPTETVYGLGADATNAAAVQRIFAAKGRPSYNPLIVHVADASHARAIVGGWSNFAVLLSTRFWPGPLTLVLPRGPTIPDAVTAGLPTVGVRVPAHPVARALLEAADRPIAAPSANRSMAISPTDGRHVAESLGDRADVILDAGPVDVGIESTVLDLSSAVPTILRPGMISRRQLADVIGEVRVASSGSATGEALPSPGMMDRHYQPRATLLFVQNREEVAATLRKLEGRRVAILTTEAGAALSARVVAMPADAAGFARTLYATLHGLDEEGFDAIVVAPIPESDEWAGIRDRLSRATSSS